MFVYINCQYPYAFHEFVAKMGWTLTPRLKDANVVLFTGGPDVDPKLYDSPRHPSTQVVLARDLIDKEMYEYCAANDILMVGICRGGQFLNVMAGGGMIQDVRGHATGKTHEAFLVDNDGEILPAYRYQVTSTHHQMMHPTKDAVIHAASQGVGERFAVHVAGKTEGSASSWTTTNDIMDILGESIEPECLSYPELGIFCFQPHPEYDLDGDTFELFSTCFEDFLLCVEGVQ
jgi:hypothetical protein